MRQNVSTYLRTEVSFMFKLCDKYSNKNELLNELITNIEQISSNKIYFIK